MNRGAARSAALALALLGALGLPAAARADTLLAWWSFNNASNDSDLLNAGGLDHLRSNDGHLLDNNPPFDDGFYDPATHRLFPVHDNFSCSPGALVDASGFQDQAGVPPQSLFRAYLDVSNLVGDDFTPSSTNNNWGSFGGSDANRPCGTAAGGSLAVTGPSNNGRSFVIHANLSGHAGIRLSWVERGTSTGFTARSVAVASDCANYTEIFSESGALSGTFSPRSAVDSGAVLDNAAAGCIRFTLAGASSMSASGNNRFDNIQLLASAEAPVVASIPQIQGSGAASPYANQRVRTTGVVTLDLQGANQRSGFFMQDAAGDGNPATSDGIFVSSTTAVSAGQQVTVTGTAVEANGQTQLVSVSSITGIAAGPAVVPTALVLPEAVDGELERYEGMLVQVSSPLTVAQNYFVGRYGQLTLAGPDDAGRPGRLQKPTNLWDAGSSEALALQDENRRRLLVLDDGQDVNPLGDNPSPVPYLGPPPPAVLRGGDRLAAPLVGVIDYGPISTPTSNLRDYRLQPTAAPSFASANPRPAQAPQVGGRLRIATFNVLNYFTTTGSRGADDAAEFGRQRAKITEAMRKLDADVLGLLEIQNNGETAVNDLVSALNALVGAGSYAAIATGTVGGDEIRTALLYRTASIEPLGAHEIFDDADDPGAMAGYNRPALLQRFRERASGETFLVALNHFKSKGSDCNAVGDPDTGDGQGNCNLTRLSMANAQVAFLASYAAGLGEPRVFILGDLNSYGAEDPIQALAAAGYRDLVKAYEGPAGYSYTFDGEVGRFDYVLANAAAQAQVVGLAPWHINTDEPAVIDYNQDFNPPGYYSADEFRASDHDIAVAGLELAPGAAQDQAFAPGTPDALLSTAGAARAAQSFRASSAGRLLQLDLLLSRSAGTSAALQLQLFRTSGGLPSGAPVASASVAAARVGEQAESISVDLRSAGVTLAAGETLAAVLSSSGDYRWSGRAAGGYAAGAALRDTGSGFAAFGGADLGFRSYAQASAPAAVPALPPALALLAALALLLGGGAALRRRWRASPGAAQR